MLDAGCWIRKHGQAGPVACILYPASSISDRSVLRTRSHSSTAFGYRTRQGSNERLIELRRVPRPGSLQDAGAQLFGRPRPLERLAQPARQARGVAWLGEDADVLRQD